MERTVLALDPVIKNVKTCLLAASRPCGIGALLGQKEVKPVYARFVCAARSTWAIRHFA